MKNKVYGFTLAEVLITLSVIGIIASITIPSFVNNERQKTTVTKLKKFYSSITDAYDIIQVEEGSNASSWINKYNDNAIIYKKISEKLNTERQCNQNDKSCASTTVVYKNLLGTSDFPHKTMNYGNYRIKLKDGTIITFATVSNNCSASYGTTDNLKTVCAESIVDINGDKGPNKLGVDAFHYLITEKEIIPSGVKGHTGEYNLENGCNRTEKEWTNGTGCFAWVVYKGNMKYLKENVSWD